MLCSVILVTVLCHVHGDGDDVLPSVSFKTSDDHNSFPHSSANPYTT